MKPGRFLPGSCLVILAIALPAVSAQVEAPVVAQDLVSVRASASVAAAMWTRRVDSYTLQIVLPFNCANISRAVTESQPAQQQAQQSERSSFFIGNTIANLRGLDPTNGGCTLTMTDGRRTGVRINTPAAPPEQPPAVPQALPVVNVAEALKNLAPQYPGAYVPVAVGNQTGMSDAATLKTGAAPPKGPPGIQVWLLRADGTQVAPAEVSTDTSNAYGCKTNCPVSGKQYRFALADGAQAVAAAIQVDDQYYIEKLQSLEPKPAAR